MVTPPPDALKGRRVLVCRPRPEAERLAGAFARAGAEVRVLPMLEREPITDDPAIRTQILNIDEFDHVIAVSPYAAGLLVDWLDTWWPQTPSGIVWYGVGAGTAAVLAAHHLDTRQPEHGHTSEALLELPELSRLEHAKVLIVRGEEGRDLLPDTLRARGARVTLLPLYRRFAPDHDEAALRHSITGFDPEVVVTLSGETLNNLISLGNNTGHNLEHCLMVVPVERIADQARKAGLRYTCVPESLADHAIVAAVADQLASLDVSPGNTK
jgi:uroporphyrinogen-III synthase